VSQPPATFWTRRARPVLGTLVEIGLPSAHAADAADEPALWAELWAVMDTVQARMSAHDADSDLGRLHAAPEGQPVTVHPWTAEVLRLARAWHLTCPAFDVALGSGAWAIEGDQAWRLSPHTRLDLGGLAKGWAVDRVVARAQALGVPALWVNAGGDLRASGCALPIHLRDEGQGGAYPWGVLEDGALATSDFRPGARSQLWHAAAGSAAESTADRPGHLSLMADDCATADALTKVVAAWGLCDPRTQGLLQAHAAQAWVHDAAHTEPA
jgi:thiamine biosynthesis lipoprotein